MGMPRDCNWPKQGRKRYFSDFLKTAQYSANITKQQKSLLRRKSNQFKMLGDDLYFEKPERIPKVVFEFEEILIRHITETEYSVAHCGINKMIALISEKYYRIPKACIIESVKACEACNLRRYADQNEGCCYIVNELKYNLVFVDEISSNVLTSRKNDPEYTQRNLEIASELYNEFNEPIYLASPSTTTASEIDKNIENNTKVCKNFAKILKKNYRNIRIK
ncbi:hypothetical protein CWI37_0989p0020 [Hamiltosporidium tvaerminnensis]|uniref:Integrase zinc-binding domain-containing protein n=1 Tax=Hamiltosporidium tvaerminnensis TaxID=1176355 RepID=A0A4Q9KZM0_9MICR|nr:hypothetical protein CWI37_0989p0020 [Hamiltosporidium tvaerminnensis]